MRNLKPLALITISLLALGAVCYSNLLVTSVSAQYATPFTGEYIWTGGYLNTSLLLVNLTEYGISGNYTKSIFAKTIMNTSLEYWEDHENYTFSSGGGYNASLPAAAYFPSYAPIYSTELSESFGVACWYNLRMQLRPPASDGYGIVYATAGVGDVDYNCKRNSTGKYNLKGGIYYNCTSDGSWIGDGTGDAAGSMWSMQKLFINVTMFLGAPPGKPGYLGAVPIVTVDMDSWMTTGNARIEVDMPGPPVHGHDGWSLSGHGDPWDGNFEACSLVSCGAEVNHPKSFSDPITHKVTPLNVSYIFTHKHVIVRKDLIEWQPPLIPADATLDGYVNVWDLGRMSDHWLNDTTSKAWGQQIGAWEDVGLFSKVYEYVKGANSVDFNGDELINVWDLSAMSDLWLQGGWAPPQNIVP